jgi:hypothetical protein
MLSELRRNKRGVYSERPALSLDEEKALFPNIILNLVMSPDWARTEECVGEGQQQFTATLWQCSNLPIYEPDRKAGH